MAIGDAATAAGYPTVPPDGEDGKVMWGYREINRTRDLLAGVEGKVPTGRPGYRSAAGIGSGPGTPLNEHGEDGDIYFKVS